MALGAVAAWCKYGLLASTLFTFQDYACDNDQLRIRCPRGSAISVRWAQYGRLATSANNDLCPAVTWQPLPARRDGDGEKPTPSPRTDWISATAEVTVAEATAKMTSYGGNSSSDRITCLAPTSLQVVVELCDERQDCHIKVNHRLFRQDPCPRIGKYVEVAYQCRPAVLQTLVACKGDALNIKCPRSRHIAVQWATYGYSRRQASENRCPSAPAFDTECEAPCSLPVVARTCHGRQRCSVTADESVFGLPCRPGTSEYLTVVYACVAERTLAELPAGLQAAVDPDVCRALVGSLGIAAAVTRSSTKDQPTTASLESTTSGSPIVAAGTVQPGVAALFRRVVDTFVTDWINVCQFMSDNVEKFILYAVLGLCIGLICVLLVVIVKLTLVIIGQRRRRHLAVEPVQKTDGPSATGPGPTPAEPSFVDSGRGSPSLAAGGTRRSTPELARRGPTPVATKSYRQRRRPSPFDFPSPSSVVISGRQTPGLPPTGAPTSGTTGGVHLPPGPDSPVFVHVESPRESPLLGRAPPTRDVTSSESAGPSPPPRTDASAAAVVSRSMLRAPLTNEFGRRPEWFRPSTPSGSSAASRTDLRQRGESPIWIRRSSADPDVDPPASDAPGRAPLESGYAQVPGNVTIELGDLSSSQRPTGYIVDDDDDTMTVVVPVMPAASSPDSSGPPLPPAWINYLSDYGQSEERPRTMIEFSRPTSTTSSVDAARSYAPQYRPLSGTASSTPRTRGYSSSSASSISPTSTMMPTHFYPHLAAASTVPRSAGSVIGPRRAAAVYPSSASLGPVPTVMIDDLASTGPGGPSSFSVGTVASQADAADSVPTLTRSFSNPFRQDSYQAVERRYVAGRTSPALTSSSLRPGSRSSSSSGRRKRHLLRFES